MRARLTPRWPDGRPVGVYGVRTDPDERDACLAHGAGLLARGRWLHTCKPAPADFSAESILTNTSVSRCGHVFVWGAGNVGWRHFGPDGRRLGILLPPLRGSRANAGGDTRWEGDFERVVLADSAARAVRIIERRPDRRWITDGRTICRAPDGSVAVLERGEGAGRPLGQVRPTRPAGLGTALAYDGRQAILCHCGEVVAYSRSGQALWRSRPALPGIAEATVTPSLAEEGVLALYDGEHTLYLRHLAEDGVGAHPPIRAPAVVADEEALSADRLDKVAVLVAVHPAQDDVAGPQGGRIGDRLDGNQLAALDLAGHAVAPGACLYRFPAAQPFDEVCCPAHTPHSVKNGRSLRLL